MDMAELWYWVYEHPSFLLDDIWYALPEALDVQYVRVNPETMSIEDDNKLNTLVQCWLEFGPVIHYPEKADGVESTIIPVHDINLDCGGDTFESAFRKLCQNILSHYGDYDRSDESQALVQG